MQPFGTLTKPFASLLPWGWGILGMHCQWGYVDVPLWATE